MSTNQGKTIRIVLIVVVALASVLVGVLVAVFTNVTPQQPEVVTQTVTQTIQGSITTVTVTPSPTMPASPVTYTFVGTGIKETEAFYIPTSEWKITATATAAPNVQDQYVSVSVVVYSWDSRRSVTNLGLEGRGTDYGIVHNGPGNYYLKVYSANCKWEVTITTPP